MIDLSKAAVETLKTLAEGYRAYGNLDFSVTRYLHNAIGGSRQTIHSRLRLLREKGLLDENNKLTDMARSYLKKGK